MWRRVEALERDVAETCEAGPAEGIERIRACLADADEEATFEAVHALRRRITDQLAAAGGGPRRHHLLVLDGWLLADSEAAICGLMAVS